jgi:hypothetical protein
MSERVLHAHRHRRQIITLSSEERTQLATIIDLLIPSDEEFPPPSSLHLLDEFIRRLAPSSASRTTLMLNEQRLRMMLCNLNTEAGGSFCSASAEQQQRILNQFEQREPAFFQELWTLANHSYYTRLATLPRTVMRS